MLRENETHLLSGLVSLVENALSSHYLHIIRDHINLRWKVFFFSQHYDQLTKHTKKRSPITNKSITPLMNRIQLLNIKMTKNCEKTFKILV